ncbi:MAG: hypothetical protein ACYDCM_05490 [Candidatus Acidiferrales bacterium]
MMHVLLRATVLSAFNPNGRGLPACENPERLAVSRIADRPGRRSADSATPPFFVRFVLNGKQQWKAFGPSKCRAKPTRVRALLSASFSQDVCYPMARERDSGAHNPGVVGHKNLETTMIYLGVADLSDPRIRSQIDAAFGD